jgi:hypothetical protein
MQDHKTRDESPLMIVAAAATHDQLGELGAGPVGADECHTRLSPRLLSWTDGVHPQPLQRKEPGVAPQSVRLLPASAKLDFLGVLVRRRRGEVQHRLVDLAFGGGAQGDE